MKLNFMNFIFADETDRENRENFMTTKISNPTVGHTAGIVAYQVGCGCRDCHCDWRGHHN